jgi:hypothetical protein
MEMEMKMDQMGKSICMFVAFLRPLLPLEATARDGSVSMTLKESWHIPVLGS